MDWERLADVGVADVIMTWLDWRDLIALERVSRFLYAQVNTEPVWRRAAQRLFEDKTFVPAFCRRLVTPGNSREHRVDLLALSVRALRLHAAHLGGVDLSECVEKAEMAAAICARELRRSYGPHECLARFAIRVALVDRHRNVPTVAELCSTQWNIRLLTHGPLGQLAPMDPWHLGRPDVGCIDFRPDGTLSVRFPPDANPFAHMGFNAEVLGYEIRGNYVQLSVGPREYVVRHPEHWGWMLISGGSHWTSFPMPPRGTANMLEDEEVLNDMVNASATTVNHGFIV